MKWRIAVILFLCLGIYSYIEIGFNSTSTGLFIGGSLALVSILYKFKRDWKITRKYIDWVKISRENNIT